MQSGAENARLVSGRLLARGRLLASGVATAFGLALLVSGCVSDGHQTGSLPSSRHAAAVSHPAAHPAVAFESVDGPPQLIFQKLVQKLSEQADALAVAVTTREAATPYRVRAYVATGQEAGQANILSWVWDVYDAQGARVHRISGEEKVASQNAGDIWGSAGDDVLTSLARKGMTQLAGFLRNPAAGEGAADASPGSSVMALAPPTENRN